MTAAQIAAIISLLVAFNVPQTTVNNVWAILQNAKTTQTSSQTVNSAATTLFITPGMITVTRPGTPGWAPYHAHLDWSTNLPANSKIFFAPVGQWQDVNPDGSVNSSYFLVPIGDPLFGYRGSTATTSVDSTSGVSTMHSASLTDLQENYRYFYTIEAISGDQDQKITGTFDTR